MKIDPEQAMNAFQEENDERRAANTRVKTTVRRTSYNWTPTDLAMMRIVKKKYGIEAEVEALRMALLALATGQIPPTE